MTRDIELGRLTQVKTNQHFNINFLKKSCNNLGLGGKKFRF